MEPICNMGNDRLIAKELIPPGGWFFKQGDTTILGMNYDDLVRSVANHRKSNDLEPGNPDKEIQEQIAERWPEGIRRV